MSKTSSNYKLSSNDAKELKDIMKAIRQTLDAEAEGIFALVTTEKRIDVKKLISNVELLMASDVFDFLPNVAKYDFEQAGKCIAFELPTAAAFHLLRGTEDVIRWFYCSIIKRNRLPEKERMWGLMIDQLRRKRRNAPPALLLDHLDYIRNNFRNPTQHPEKIYDMDESQDLFNLCTEAINKVIKCLKDRGCIGNNS